MIPVACCPLPSPKTVSISTPAVMYMRPPASATTLSPGSSSTSTNCTSSPTILKSMSWDRRPGTGGGAAARAGPDPRWTRKRSTSLRGVQLSMPAMKTSVLPSALPFLRLETISSSLTGPTWWPPTAMYHCGLVDIVLPPGIGGRAVCGLRRP
jgi:hypothetical protein